MPLTAAIANISRCSVHDGPGVRTVVYFKGCGLRCRWCHNPETLSAKPVIVYAPAKCIGCGRCVSICPQHHKMKDGQMQIIRQDCLLCGKCAEFCPTGALEMSGRAMTVAQVFEEIQKDIHYFQREGGVTLSGGECLLQADFAAHLLKTCKEAGIHTLVESALFVPWEAIEKVLPDTDMFFADLKIAEGQKHKQYTGQENALILENLQKLCRQAGHSVVVRTPLIPGVNDNPEEIRALAQIIARLGEGLLGVELLRYNHLAKGKYEMVGLSYESFGGGPQSDAQMAALKAEMEKGLPPRIPVSFR